MPQQFQKLRCQQTVGIKYRTKTIDFDFSVPKILAFDVTFFEGIVVMNENKYVFQQSKCHL